MMLAVVILAMVTTLTYMTFSTVIGAWRQGSALSEELHHGDYIMEQIVTGLRSAYYPDVNNPAVAYGFVSEDNGSDASSSDSISWVKVGGSLVGRNCPFAGTPHRVKISVENDDNGRQAIAVRAWRVNGEPEDFDPAKVKPVFISGRVTGMNCRMTEPFPTSGVVEWLDDWKETNRVPPGVEITLYMEPLEPGGKPVEFKRVVGLPIASLSWRHDFSAPVQAPNPGSRRAGGAPGGGINVGNVGVTTGGKP